MDYIRKNLKRIIPTFLLIAGVGMSFWNFIRDNSARIASQNAEYLDELTLQRAISINSMTEENLTFIRSTAYLYGKSLTSPWADVSVIREFEENTVFDSLRYVDASGDDYTSQGVLANLSDRDYFQAGMRGESGMTYVLSSRVTGQRQIGFYAPVTFNSQIIGIMVGFYGEDFIRSLLEYELFGQTGSGWLVTGDGTVLGTTFPEEPENFLDYLRREERCDEAGLQAVEAAFQNEGEASFAYREGEELVDAYCVSLENSDWVLVRTFPAAASALILKNANREGVLLIGQLLGLFAVYVAVLMIEVLYDHKRMRAEARKAGDISTGVSRLFTQFITLDLNTGQGEDISPAPSEQTTITQGDYSILRQVLLDHIPDEAQRAQAAAFFDTDYLKQALQDTDRSSIRVHLVGKKDRWFTYNCIVIARDENQVPARLLVVCQDVTDLHHKEEQEQEQLQQALGEAERASKAKTEFLFNMSHDLRTPMNAIIGYTNLAQREGVSLPQMQGFIRKIDASSAHLLALINDILEMSRIESGKLTLEPVSMDVVQVMEEAKELFASQMKEKQIDFTVQADQIRDRYVFCDKNRLNRVLLNLLSNACKFTNEGGTVSALLRQTGADLEGETQMARFELRVKDSGIGMSEAFAKKLFTPFERERTSTVSGIQGTGLGLSITKKIVDLMGGTIQVETAQGKGTTFVICLAMPVDEAAGKGAGEEAGKETVASSAQGAPKEGAFAPEQVRLLLVEDNEINREIAKAILSQSGFLLESAVNGQEAVDLVSASAPGTFDAVLMDIQMPVMDGYTAARAIRALEDPALAGIPIIAMTANAFAEDVQAALAAGMNGHIAKPLDVGKMLSTIQEVLWEAKSRQKSAKTCPDGTDQGKKQRETK